jgi:curli biogenesis system outer membrane secretion channel CsgG
MKNTHIFKTTLGFVTSLCIAISATVHAQDAKKPARIPVAIYEMRSSVSEIQARAATDMFTTALVKTKKFRVMERQRIGDGVAKERDLNAQGITTGDAATKKVKGAGVIFEATISEVSIGKSTNESGISIGGLQIGGGKAEDGMGIDVRVLDASTGEVLDAINVRRAIKSTASSVGGVGALLDNVLAAKGKSTGGFTPDISNKSSTRESMDETLRTLIEDAVNQLTKRSGEWELE